MSLEIEAKFWVTDLAEFRVRLLAAYVLRMSGATQ